MHIQFFNYIYIYIIIYYNYNSKKLYEAILNYCKKNYVHQYDDELKVNENYKFMLY